MGSPPSKETHPAYKDLDSFLLEFSHRQMNLVNLENQTVELGTNIVINWTKPRESVRVGFQTANPNDYHKRDGNQGTTPNLYQDLPLQETSGSTTFPAYYVCSSNSSCWVAFYIPIEWKGLTDSTYYTPIKEVDLRVVLPQPYKARPPTIKIIENSLGATFKARVNFPDLPANRYPHLTPKLKLTQSIGPVLIIPIRSGQQDVESSTIIVSAGKCSLELQLTKDYFDPEQIFTVSTGIADYLLQGLTVTGPKALYTGQSGEIKWTSPISDLKRFIIITTRCRSVHQIFDVPSESTRGSFNSSPFKDPGDYSVFFLLGAISKQNPTSHAQLPKFSIKVIIPEHLPGETPTGPSAFKAQPHKPRTNEVTINQEIALGAGAFAQVHEGLLNGRTVAVKLFNVEQKRDALAQQQEEADLMKMLKHENIVEYIQSCLIGSRFGIVMEKMELDLAKYMIRRETLITKEQKRFILINVCKGIKYLHSRSVIHGDIKPQNILMDTFKNEIFEVKICDFGQGKVKTAVSQTSTAVRTYTIKYAAPEIMDRTLGKVGSPSDIFSFATVIWELLNDSTPFLKVDYGDDADALRYLITKQSCRCHNGFASPLLPTNWKNFEDPLRQCWNISTDVRPTIQEIYTLLSKVAFKK